MTGRHEAEGLSLVDRNPVAIRAAVGAAVTAVVHLLVVFGVPITKAQGSAIGGVVDAVGLLVIVAWARAGVTPNAKVVTRVTTKGTVVTGDAALTTTGTTLALTPGRLPRVQPVIVKPDLVDSAA